MSAKQLAVEDIGNGDFVILDEGSNSVARVYDRALAHQFAAAPDLLDALRMFVGAEDPAAGCDSQLAAQEARERFYTQREALAAAAISKAEGKEVAA